MAQQGLVVNSGQRAAALEALAHKHELRRSGRGSISSAEQSPRHRRRRLRKLGQRQRDRVLLEEFIGSTVHQETVERLRAISVEPEMQWAVKAARHELDEHWQQRRRKGGDGTTKQPQNADWIVFLCGEGFSISGIEPYTICSCLSTFSSSADSHVGVLTPDRFLALLRNSAEVQYRPDPHLRIHTECHGLFHFSDFIDYAVFCEATRGNTQTVAAVEEELPVTFGSPRKRPPDDDCSHLRSPPKRAKRPDEGLFLHPMLPETHKAFLDANVFADAFRTQQSNLAWLGADGCPWVSRKYVTARQVNMMRELEVHACTALKLRATGGALTIEVRYTSLPSAASSDTSCGSPAPIRAIARSLSLCGTEGWRTFIQHAGIDSVTNTAHTALPFFCGASRALIETTPHTNRCLRMQMARDGELLLACVFDKCCEVDVTIRRSADCEIELFTLDCVVDKTPFPEFPDCLSPSSPVGYRISSSRMIVTPLLAMVDDQHGSFITGCMMNEQPEITADDQLPDDVLANVSLVADASATGYARFENALLSRNTFGFYFLYPPTSRLPVMMLCPHPDGGSRYAKCMFSRDENDRVRTMDRNTFERWRGRNFGAIIANSRLPLHVVVKDGAFDPVIQPIQYSIPQTADGYDIQAKRFSTLEQAAEAGHAVMIEWDFDPRLEFALPTLTVCHDSVLFCPLSDVLDAPAIIPVEQYAHVRPMSMVHADWMTMPSFLNAEVALLPTIGTTMSDADRQRNIKLNHRTVCLAVTLSTLIHKHRDTLSQQGFASWRLSRQTDGTREAIYHYPWIATNLMTSDCRLRAREAVTDAELERENGRRCVFCSETDVKLGVLKSQGWSKFHHIGHCPLFIEASNNPDELVQCLVNGLAALETGARQGAFRTCLLNAHLIRPAADDDDDKDGTAPLSIGQQPFRFLLERYMQLRTETRKEFRARLLRLIPRQRTGLRPSGALYLDKDWDEVVVPEPLRPAVPDVQRFSDLLLTPLNAEPYNATQLETQPAVLQQQQPISPPPATPPTPPPQEAPPVVCPVLGCNDTNASEQMDIESLMAELELAEALQPAIEWILPDNVQIAAGTDDGMDYTLYY